MKTPSANRQAAALMLSLWALFLLSAMVISWALDINGQITISGAANRAFEAEAMACSGAEIALHPAIKPGSPVLHGSIGRGQRYDVRITGEGGRLNLNWILAGENPARKEILRKYLENKGVDLNERDKMIDCLLDWVDPDNLVRLNGAEEEGDYHPSNALLTRIEDLKKIRGWAEFTSTADWDADLRIAEPIDLGRIDLVWASRDVLLTLPGINEARVDQFLSLRRGADGIEATSDDTEFKTAEEALVALGYFGQQLAIVQPLVVVNFPLFRVFSVGKSADVKRIVQMVIQKESGGRATLKPGTWKEL
ncbi:MAG: general secretion pathway protein GspK [Chthoniobacterales bacterium]